MKLGTDPKTRMYLWLRKKREKNDRLVDVPLANADGLGKIVVKKGALLPF